MIKIYARERDKSNHVQAGIISSDSTKPTKVLQYHNWHLQKNCISTIKHNPLLKWVSLNHTTTKRKTIYCQPSTAPQIIKGYQFEHWVLTQSMLCINPAALLSEGSNKQHTCFSKMILPSTCSLTCFRFWHLSNYLVHLNIFDIYWNERICSKASWTIWYCSLHRSHKLPLPFHQLP